MKTKNRIWTFLVIIMGLVMVLTNSCKKEEAKGQIPVLTTSEVVGITKTTATCGGDISFDGGSSITSRGVCWSTTVNPSITDNKTVDGIGISQFVSSLSGLTPGTSYHVRAYATNSVGTAYGIDGSFTTYKSNTITDIDGNYYNIVTIDSQTWMEENLKTTRYRNGDLIGTTTPATLDISAEATPKYQWEYNGNESNGTTYGRLYTWYAITDIRNVCPAGWHVPADAEWTTLLTFLGGDEVAGGKLKEKGQTHWAAPNTGATNETGFTALPGGFRDVFDSRTFWAIDSVGVWWNSDESTTALVSIRYIERANSGAYRNPSYKMNGNSVRCLKDN